NLINTIPLLFCLMLPYHQVKAITFNSNSRIANLKKYSRATLKSVYWTLLFVLIVFLLVLSREKLFLYEFYIISGLLLVKYLSSAFLVAIKKIKLSYSSSSLLTMAFTFTFVIAICCAVNEWYKVKYKKLYLGKVELTLDTGEVLSEGVSLIGKTKNFIFYHETIQNQERLKTLPIDRIEEYSEIN
ncbi:MAG: hypothetical protein AAGD05_17690, partial [Bacteroidota bacterium]